MTGKQKKQLTKIIISGILLILLAFTHFTGYLKFIVYIIPYLIVGFPVLRSAVINISHGQVFDENFLMCIATIGALCVGEYPEAVFVMLFYQVGDLFETIAVGKSRNSITELMDICPEYVNIEKDGEISEIDPDEACIDDIMVIKPGEKVPLDGIIIEGSSSLNTTALTGESLPLDVNIGDSITSGTDITKAQGQETTRKFNALIIQSVKLPPVTNGGMNASATAEKTTAGV